METDRPMSRDAWLLGSVAAVAGVTVGLVLVTLDGLAARRLAEA